MKGKKSKSTKKGPKLAVTASDFIRPGEGFPLHPLAVLASLLFWICMGVLAFKAFQYFSVYRSLNDLDMKGDCAVKFLETVSENVEFIENYPKGEAGPYLNRIGSQKFTDSFIGTDAPSELTSVPVIVTAVSTEDFWNVQRLIRDLVEDGKKKEVELTMFIYDIGLYKSERTLIEKYCKCEVRNFEASVYPNHVSEFKNKAFRPIIIQTLLEKHGSVMWLDPSVSVKSVRDLNMLKYRGKRDFILWEETVFTTIVSYTHPKMFEYLGEKRCTFSEMGMIDMRAMVFYRANLTWHGIMKPWLKCALNIDCIAPQGSRTTECLHYNKPRMTGCHWYDQSALSIIINRVFQFTAHIDKFSLPRLTSSEVKDVVYYFPEQPWSYTELTMLFTMPLVVVAALFYIYMRRVRSSKASYLRR